MFLRHIVIAEGIQEHVGPGFHPGVVCVTRHLIWFGSNGRENCGKIFGDAMADCISHGDRFALSGCNFGSTGDQNSIGILTRDFDIMGWTRLEKAS